MDTAGLSTAVMLALAAVLWFLYFVPTWIRRREYLATERTATRLQRTIRIMAESAEAPEEMRVEASAREAARVERIRIAQEREIARRALRDAQVVAADRARIEADRRRAAALRVGSAAAMAEAGPAASGAATGTTRRAAARRWAGLLLLAAIVVGAVQVLLMVTRGIAPGAWLVLTGAVSAAFMSIAWQNALRRRTAAPAQSRAAASVPVMAASDSPPVAAPRSWTPQPVPRPRYLEHPEATPLGPSLGAPTMDAAARLRVAAAAAARPDPRVAAIAARRDSVDVPAPSPYSAMGVVGELGDIPALDEVLARRRRVS